MWHLGGKIISDMHETPRLRKRPIDQVLLAALDDEYGLLLFRESEDQQRSITVPPSGREEVRRRK
jgi:hypothetical protein